MNIRKPLSRILAFSLGCSTALQGIAISAEETVSDPAVASVSDTSLSIGNSKISRDFTIEDGKVFTDLVTNEKINRSLDPGQGSEDFVISAKYTGGAVESDSSAAIENTQKFDFSSMTGLDRSDWGVTLISTKNGQPFTSSATHASKIIDGDRNTNPDDYENAGNPTEVIFDMKEEQTISSFSVDKRPGYLDQAYGINGTMGKFEVYSSSDGQSWTKFFEGEFTEEEYNLHQEDTLYNVGDTVGRNFDSPVTTRYIKIRQLSNAIGVQGEFTTSEINFYQDKAPQTVAAPTQALDRTGWTGSITPKNNGKLTDAGFQKLIDGDLSTHPDEGGPGEGNHNGFPIHVDIDLGSEQTISSFSVNKRPGYGAAQSGINGTMGDYEICTSEDGTNWTKVSQGSIPAFAYNLHKEGDLFNVGDTVYVNLHEAITTRHIRLSVLSNALGDSEDFTMAELNYYSDPYQGPDYRTASSAEPAECIVRTSDLTYESAREEDVENGKKLTISFEPFKVGEATWDVDEIFILEDGKDYMRSFLEITTDTPSDSVIDYIDQDAFVIPEGDASTVWHHPNSPRNTVGGLKGYEFLLGQPVYIDGMYMGSEFPAADTTVPDNSSTIQVRYYSGKSFARLKQDNQLTTDGKFVSWQNVIGSARGTSVSEVQSDFFEYINDIATPTVFRKQYNSWYDNMKGISDESIEVSFTQVEENLAANGVDPLDAYVVDDGWIPYNNGNPAESGNTPNKTGFWEINDKFPDDFYRSTAFASKLQSTFGVWIGPRGGYGSEGSISSIIQNAGTGYKSSFGDICVGSRKYIRNFKDFAIMNQQDYGVEYWKWDGFAMQPCTSKNHDHMTGGPNNIYYTTDLWEGWTDLFETVRADAASRGKPLFINATCFVQLSPWLLQWVNTIWLQDSADTQETGTGESHEQKIYYRDNVYYNLFNEYQVQFPSKNLYNHEPIYGVSDLHGASNCSDEAWREYLLANAMRGTRFWELYYSPSIVNTEKYEITADVLEWMETNQDVLGNTKMFGGRPGSAEVYGYSAWTADEGIVSFTNPKATAAVGTLVLDAQAGVVAGMGKKSAIQVEPFETGIVEGEYAYGDTLSVELAPHETKILHFGTSSKAAPAILSAKNADNSTLAIKFDQRVQPVSATIDGVAVEASLRDDYRTINLPWAVASSENVKVALTIQDAWGTEKTVTVDVPVYRNNLIVDTNKKGVLSADADTKYDVSLGDTLMEIDGKAYALNTDTPLEGSSDFTIHTSIKTESKGADLFRSGDAVRLAINDEGFVEFTMDGRTVVSKEVVTHVDEKATGTFGTDEYVPHRTSTEVLGNVADGQTHTIDAVRTANGMMKIFIDGQLRASLHDPAVKGLSLKAGDMVLGSSGLSGTIGRLTVTNGAATLDEIEDKAPTEDGSTMMLDRTSWTAEACSSANSGGDLGPEAALDGNAGTRWHSQYDPVDSCTSQNHWIQVNFNQATSVDTIYYTGRGADINGSFKDYKLEILGENGEVLLTKEGTMTSSTDAQPVELGEVVRNAWGFKLTQKSSWNGRNFAAAVELAASVVPTPLSEEQLAVEKAKLDLTLDGDHYTQSTLEAFTALKNSIESATNADDVRWAALVAEFNAARAALVDTTDLDATIAAAGAITDLDNVAEELVASFYQAQAQARAAKVNGTAEEVAAADAALKAAIEALKDTPKPEVNKTQLQLVLESVSALDQDECVPSTIEGLGAALDAASDVFETSEDQSEVNEAASALNAKLLAVRFKPASSKLDALQ